MQDNKEEGGVGGHSNVIASFVSLKVFQPENLMYWVDSKKFLVSNNCFLKIE